MWTDQALLKLSDKTAYSREELFQALSGEKTDLSDSTFRWTLYNLLREQKIFRTDYDTYVKYKPIVLPTYRPYYSEKANTLIEKLSQQYPQLDFVVFESVLLNEFLNQLIAQNTIYVQVEKDVSSYIFDNLQEEYAGSVLYKPGKKDFERYWKRDCVVVLDLISQAPIAQDNPHEMTIEKMLVDIIAEKSMAVTFSPSEIPFVYKNAMRSYKVDRRKMERYAGRRGKKSQIKYAGGSD